MTHAPGHAGSAWLEHAGPAVVIGALFAVLWQPGVVVSAVNEQREGRIGELAALLGEPVSRPAEIERILPAATPFPPNAEATRSLAEALAACGMSALSEPTRLQLARRVYAITTGGDLLRNQLELTLREIQQTAIDARCSPIVVTAIVDSARRVARCEPNPRRDWW